ncbi:ComF family protein [Seinonella peptonophila]|nr:phosphoribosyltransferase family protein [Seinonella peptonophila]
MDRQSEICLDCEQASHRLINRSVVEYSAFAKQLIWLYKFRGDQSLAEPIGRMMAENVQINWQKKSFIITYVPLTSERLLERGFNQAQLLAEVIGSQLRMPVIPLLKREHFIGAQSQKGRVERIQSLTNAFSVLEEVSLMLWVDRPVLIVDDIYTTGTTLRECAKPLQIAGVEEICTTTFAR